MLKKLLFAVVAFVMVVGNAFAEVEVNKADQAALDGIRGIGPAMSRNILEERKKNGDFRDWADLENRVSGIGQKNALKLSGGGLIVNGKPKAAAAVAREADAGKAKK